MSARRSVEALALSAVLSLLPAAGPSADLDRDGVDDPLDNCITIANPAQEDADSDRIGDACQCGDVTDDGVVDASDVAALRDEFAGLPPGTAAPAKCKVTVGGTCSVLDVAIVERALADLPPGVEQVCVPSAVASVDDHGAVGDGLTYDHAAIQQAIGAAGIGGLVLFTPGKTYNICKTLSAVAGQTWWGYGSTLRRCDSVQSTLTSSASAGATIIHVADASGFEAGMAITPTFGPASPQGEAPYGRRVIANISENTITLYSGLGQSYSAGDPVITIDDIARSSASFHDFSVIGLTFDANWRNNDAYIAWQQPSSILLKGRDFRVKGCTFLDTWSDAIDFVDVNGAAILRNVFSGGGGSAAHLTLARNVSFVENDFLDLNQDATNAGHSEAAITWSALNEGITIARNCFRRIGAAAVGEVGLRGNRDVLVEGNQVCDCQGFFLANLDQEPLPRNTPTGNIRIRNNTVLNSGRSRLWVATSALSPVEDFVFEDNVIRNGYLDIEGVSAGSISRNTFVMDDPATYEDGNPSYEDRAGLLTLRRGVDIAIADNTLVGGDKGIYVTNEDGVVLSGILITRNMALDQTNDALEVGKISDLGRTDWRGEYGGVIVEASTFYSTVVDGGEDIARVGRHAEFRTNCVESNEKGVRVFGDPATTGTPDTRYLSNVLVAGREPLSYEAAGLLNDLEITFNVWNQDIPAVFYSGMGNLIQNNTVDPGAACSPAYLQDVPTACSCGR